MEADNRYQKTIYACFTGYIVQAIVNNFVPLLFLTFISEYDIPLSMITMLVSINFVVQLLVDALSVPVIERIGYRASMIIGQLTVVVGFISLTILPEVMPDPFVGILISVMLYAIGGGVLEVLVSPIVEACPTKNKEKTMSLLHSFYCWGHVGVVVISTLFFYIFGIENWRVMAVIWAAIPLINSIVFTKVPIATLVEEGKGLTIKELFKDKIFWVLVILMICAGASEQAVSQWSSTFAEKALNVDKVIGDLAGPMLFAICMGLARVFYSKYGHKIKLQKFILWCSGLCVVSYLIISLVPIPAIGFIGCGLCGMSVGIMWPGTFSVAASTIKGGGTAMFAFLALAGDVGCASGPGVVGFISGMFNDDLRKGILAAIVFPVIMIAGLILFKKFSRKQMCEGE